MDFDNANLNKWSHTSFVENSFNCNSLSAICIISSDSFHSKNPSETRTTKSSDSLIIGVSRISGIELTK